MTLNIRNLLNKHASIFRRVPDSGGYGTSLMGGPGKNQDGPHIFRSYS